MIYYKQFLILFFLVLTAFGPVSAKSYPDSLIFTNGNIMVGEIKEMTKGVLTVKTAYSDKDFRIDWKHVSEVYSNTYFLITLHDGGRYNGKLESVSSQALLIITNTETIQTYLDAVVFLKPVNANFWSRLSATVDVGFNLAKSNNLRQLNTAASFTYWADRWLAGLQTSSLFSRQTDVEPTKRTSGSLNFNYFLPKDWYIPVAVDFLSNSEQQLDIRINGKVGYGKYVIHTNRAYWGFSGGIAYNNEKFYNEDHHQNSIEGYLGSELNLFDTGDLNLLTKINAYPSFTDWGRWRMDFSIDTKYDLPLEFYIKFSNTINFDSRPTEGASKSDYVFTLGFGWEWN
jgi:hypothetical protein